MPASLLRAPWVRVTGTVLMGTGLVMHELCADSTKAGSASASPCPLPGATLFEGDAFHEISIEVSPAGLESLREHPRRYVRATVRWGGSAYDGVGARLKGAVGSFRAVDDKPSFTLDFRRFSPDQRADGLERVYLNNSVEDASCLHERLGAESFAAAGVPAPRVAHARVRLNNRALGLYVLKEGYTADFLGIHFARADGGLYDDDWACDVDQRLHRNAGAGPEPESESEFDAGQAAIEVLAEAIREPDERRRWDRMNQVLDVDRFLRFMVLEVMLVHRDGYCLARNNFRVYHDPGADRLVFLADGMDQLFEKADYPWKPRMAGLVAAAVMGTHEGQEGYTKHFNTLMALLFGAEAKALVDRVDGLARKLRPHLTRRELSVLDAEAKGLKERIVERWRDLQHQLSQPSTRPLQFVNHVGRPSQWVKTDEVMGARLDEVRGADGARSLRIKAGVATTASWRAAVELEPGEYRFQGRGRVAGVEPLAFGQHQGAGVRVSGRTRTGGGVVGDSAWRTFETWFRVDRPKETVELICELRASAGEFWVDLDSLCVVQAHGPGSVGVIGMNR